MATASIGTRLVSRPTTTGASNIPKTGPVILVVNHVSNIDPVIIGASIGRKRLIRALAKDSLFSVPILGAAMRKMGHIPVARNTRNANKALETAVERITSGEVTLIYPEGGIPENLSKVGKLKTGAARLALLTGATVIPVAQWGAQNVLVTGRPLSIFKAFLTRPRARIVVGKPVESNLVTGLPIRPEDLNQSSVLALTEELQQLIESMVSDLR